MTFNAQGALVDMQYDVQDAVKTLQNAAVQGQQQTLSQQGSKPVQQQVSTAELQAMPLPLPASQKVSQPGGQTPQLVGQVTQKVAQNSQSIAQMPQAVAKTSQSLTQGLQSTPLPVTQQGLQQGLQSMPLPLPLSNTSASPIV